MSQIFAKGPTVLWSIMDLWNQGSCLNKTMRTKKYLWNWTDLELIFRMKWTLKEIFMNYIVEVALAKSTGKVFVPSSFSVTRMKVVPTSFVHNFTVVFCCWIGKGQARTCQEKEAKAHHNSHIMHGKRIAPEITKCKFLS